MKRKTKEKSLVRSLVWSYLLLPLTVVLILICVTILGAIILRSSRIVYLPNPETFQRYKSYLKRGQYERFPIEKVAPSDTQFVVLDQSGQLTYASSGAKLRGLNQEELALIETIGKNTSVTWSMTPFTNREGQKGYFLKYNRFKSIRFFFGLMEVQSAEDSTKNNGSSHQTLLDQDFQVISSTLWTKGTSLKNLGPFLNQKQLILKYLFVTDRGEERTLVLYFPVKSVVPRFFTDIGGLLFLVVTFGFYILFASLFAIWLNRKVRLPLNRLRQAINSLTDRQQSHVLDYQGPSEFVEIIEDFNQVSNNLRRSEEESRRLQAEKQEMLANISHDLKTPITVIKGYSEAMRDGLIKPEQQDRYLEAISQKSRKLTHLIDTFHNYSQIDHPDFTLQEERLDICSFLQNYLAQHRQEFDLKGYRLELSLSHEAPFFCYLDRGQFERVLDNLLANFFSHSAKASTLFIGLEAQEQQLRLLVADDGPGIDPDQGAQLFQPFVTGDKARPSKSGSGLGLAIVQRIIDKHGGRIWLEQPPRPPYKTVFVITIPVRDEALAAY